MNSGQDRIRLVVDITLDAVPIQGWISRVDDGWSQPFTGWIDLAGHLEAARGRADQGAPRQPEPGRAQDPADGPSDGAAGHREDADG